MFSDSTTLVDGIDSLVHLADGVHNLLRDVLNPNEVPEEQAVIKKVAAELRRLAGCLHSLHLLALDLTDRESQFPTESNLNYLRACRQTLILLRITFHHPKASDIILKADIRDGFSGHKAHSRRLTESDVNLMRGMPSQLANHSVRLSLALVSDNLPALLDTLSQRMVSLGHPGQSWTQTLQPPRLPYGCMDKREQEIYSGLRPFDPLILRNTLAQRAYLRFNPISTWIDDEPLFQAWKNFEDNREPSVSGLWLHGEPGVGKSGLATLIVEQLESQSITVCYHFVDWTSDDTKRPEFILGSLICQLAEYSRHAYLKLREHFYIDWSKDDNESTPLLQELVQVASERRRDFTSMEALSDIFKMLQEEFHATCIVIDGLDELDNTEDLAKITSLCHATSRLKTKVLLLSRENELIRELCGSNNFSSLKVVPRPSDLRAYVETAIRQKQEVGSLSINPETRNLMLDALTAQCLNFRFVECNLSSLLDLPSDERRSKALDTLPATLDETYATILMRSCGSETTSRPCMAENVYSVDRSVLRTALCWIAKLSVSSRKGVAPELDIPQLCQALSIYISPDATRLSQLNAVDVSRVARLLGPLVRKYDATHWQLGHKTVYDYLQQLTPADACVGYFKTGLEDMDASLTTVLLQFISFSDFANAPADIHTENRLIRERQTSSPLYGWASAWWPSLYKTLQDGTHLLELQLFSTADGNIFVHWIMEYCLRHFPSIYDWGNVPGPLLKLSTVCIKNQISPLHIAAALGLPDLCRTLIEDRGADVNQKHEASGLGSPLFMALVGPQVFRMFASNARPSTWEILQGRSSLSHPTSIDQRSTIMTLIELGADCGVLGTYDGVGASMASISLMTCAILEDSKLFRILIDKGAKFDEEFLRTLVHTPLGTPQSGCALVRRNYVMSESRKACLDEIYQYIVDKSIAEIVPSSKNLDTLVAEDVAQSACSWAEYYNLPCSKLINKRPVVCTDEMFRALVHKCVGSPYGGILRRLMQDSRWDPNESIRQDDPACKSSSGSEGETLLHLTVEENQLETLELLLENGSDHTRRDVSGRTPLLLAETGDALKILLDHGADITARDNEGRSIWHFAAANNDHRLLKALIEQSKGDEIDKALRVTTNQGRTPLAEAFVFIRELIDRSFPPSGSAGEKPDAALLLLPHCKEDKVYFQSDVPLIHLAAEWGVDALVNGLANSGGADLNAVAEDGSTALHFLNFSATKDFIKLLKSKCAVELPLQRKDGKTPAETILRNFKTDSGQNGDEHFTTEQNGHPSFKATKFSSEAFQELLSLDTIKSKDATDRTLWERFCDDIMLHYAQKTGYWPLIHTVMEFVSSRLVEAGCHRVYEEQHQKSAFLPLVAGIWAKAQLIPPWLMKPCLSVLASDSQHFDTVKDDSATILTIRWAVGGGREDLVKALLSRGVSPHTQARGLSVLDEACLAGGCDLPIFKELLKYVDVARLNETNVLGRSPLQSLCFETYNDPSRQIVHREAKLRALIEVGADPNLMYEDQDELRPPVVWAVTKNLTDCALVLMDKGADMGAKSSTGMDVALAAATKGNLRILAYLKEKVESTWDWKAGCSIPLQLGSGRDLWRKTLFHGCNALHLAALYGQASAMEFYLRNGYLSVHDTLPHHGLDALHFAAISGSTAVIRFLLDEGANINSRAVDQATPLHQAVRSRQFNAVKTLLELGCDKSPRESDGLTPVIEAIRYNAPVTSAILIDALTGETRDLSLPPSEKVKIILGEAMETAIRYMDTKMCKALLVEGCPVDIILPSCQGCTPLMLTVRQGKGDFTKLLLDGGAQRFSGFCKKHFSRVFSAVHEACLKEKGLPCLKHLLNAALRLGQNWIHSKVTPLQVATEQKNIGALKMLLEHIKEHSDQYSKWLPFKPSSHSNDASSSLDIKPDPIVRAFVNVCLDIPDIDAPYYDGSTALHMALVSKDNMPIIRLLIENGADPNSQDVVLYSPLHVAIKERQFEAVELLLKHGADANLRDGDGYTMLMRACRAGRLDTVELLLKHGADPFLKCSEGMSMLSFCAEQNGSPEIFQYLLTTFKLDLYARDKMGYSPVHDAFLNCKFTAYILSGNIDLDPVADGEDLSKSLFTVITELEDADMILPRILRRWPKGRLAKFLNTWPERYVSPLCNVATRGYVNDLKLFLKYGADIEFEGCEQGSPLMAAAAHGRLDVVQTLVKRGARIAYVDGKGKVKNAVEMADKFKDIREWLLVERYTEQNRLMEKDDAEQGEIPTVCWSGGWEIEYVLTGTSREHGQTSEESTLDYLKRCAEIKKGFRGKIVMPFLRPVEIELGDDSTVSDLAD